MKIGAEKFWVGQKKRKIKKGNFILGDDKDLIGDVLKKNMSPLKNII